MTRFAPFTHARRVCHWCEVHFTPLATLSPRSTEHFCSASCAFARHHAKALEVMSPGAYDDAKRAAVEARAVLSMEIVARLRAGRVRAQAQREEAWCEKGE